MGRAYVEKRRWTSPDGAKKTAWRCRFDEPGPDGAPVLRSETFTTKAAADRRLRQIQAGIDAGTHTGRSALTVAELIDRWMEAKPDLADATRNAYRNAVKRLPPGFLARRAADVTPMDAQAVADGLRARGLSAHSIQTTMTPLRAACRQAVRWRMLPYSPLDGVMLPTPRKASGSAWSPEEARRFLGHAAGGGHPRWGIVWRTLLATGLRSGELRALRWSDLDAGRRLLHVNRTVTTTVDGRMAIGADAKTPAGRRVVPVSPELTAAMLALPRASPLIFPSDHGVVLSQGVVHRALRIACAAVGVPAVSPHDLRRTWVVMLRISGVDAEIVRALAGHSSIVMTLDVYARSDEARERQAIESLDRLFGERLAGGGDPAIAPPDATT